MKKLSALFFAMLFFGLSLNAQEERESAPGDVLWENFGHSIDLLLENMDSVMTIFLDGQDMAPGEFPSFNFDENFMSEEERQYFEREMEKWSLDFEKNTENFMQEFEKGMENIETNSFDLESWDVMLEQLIEQLGDWYQGELSEDENEQKEEKVISQDMKLKKI